MPYRRHYSGSAQSSQYPLVCHGHPLARAWHMGGVTPAYSDGRLGLLVASGAVGRTLPRSGQRHGYQTIKTNGSTDVGKYNFLQIAYPITFMCGITPEVITSGVCYVSVGKNVDTDGFAIRIAAASSNLSLDFPGAEWDTGWAPTAGTRYMIAVTIDNASPRNLQLYVNGISKGTSTVTVANAPTSSSFTAFGGAKNGAGTYQNLGSASIDFWGEWGRILAQDEIVQMSDNPWQIFSPAAKPTLYPIKALPSTSLYMRHPQRARQPQVPTTLSFGNPYARGIFMAGTTPLNGDGKFGPLSSAQGITSTGPTGTRPKATQRHDHIGTKFNGTTDVVEYKVTPPPYPLTFAVSVTFNTVSAANKAIMSLGRSIDTDGVGLRFSSGAGSNLCLDTPSELWNTGWTPTVSQFRYTIFVTVDASKNAQLFIDGVLKATHTFTSSLISPSTAIGFGAENSGSNYQYFSDASIDFWGVWERILARDEIRVLSNNPWQLFSMEAWTREYTSALPVPAGTTSFTSLPPPADRKRRERYEWMVSPVPADVQPGLSIRHTVVPEAQRWPRTPTLSVSYFPTPADVIQIGGGMSSDNPVIKMNVRHSYIGWMATPRPADVFITTTFRDIGFSPIPLRKSAFHNIYSGWTQSIVGADAPTPLSSMVACYIDVPTIDKRFSQVAFEGWRLPPAAIDIFGQSSNTSTLSTELPYRDYRKAYSYSGTWMAPTVTDIQANSQSLFLTTLPMWGRRPLLQDWSQSPIPLEHLVPLPQTGNPLLRIPFNPQGSQYWNVPLEFTPPLPIFDIPPTQRVRGYSYDGWSAQPIPAAVAAVHKMRLLLTGVGH